MVAEKPLPRRLGRALDDFRSRPPRSSRRQIEVQRWCVSQLSRRGVKGAQVEVSLPGAYRNKNWDVALVVDNKPRLAISCKSIVSNIAGTVPNRLDDMLGEAVNLHRAYPSCVIGYLLFLSERDMSSGTPAGEWFDRCGQRLALCYPRLSPGNPHERWEAISLCLLPDAAPASRYTPFSGCDDLNPFFSRLVDRYNLRFA